ncbi:MAG: tRNA epoxyqueuosine(34) reductase QueG [Planctomycetaceae bacterium]|nr:tRNA epoxyqueuosine(34) reductase QueG [Planctomycetaceae bacterium]
MRQKGTNTTFVNHNAKYQQSLHSLIYPFGFELCGVTAAVEARTFASFERYIGSGMHGVMTHLAGQGEARRHPRSILPGVRSLIMLAVPYAAVLGSEPHPVKQLTGIAEYARGIDYHTWIRRRFKMLISVLQEKYTDARFRGVVDTAPLLEKEFAAAAGLGFIGKNTLLINPHCGSKIFLAAVLTTAVLTAAERDEAEVNTPAPLCAAASCGNCTRCLDACPAGALVEPYVLDARRCISYRNQFTAEDTGNSFFGCDICQNVCPHNRHIPHTAEGNVDPFMLDAETLRVMTKGSPAERRHRGV